MKHDAILAGLTTGHWSSYDNCIIILFGGSKTSVARLEEEKGVNLMQLTSERGELVQSKTKLMLMPSARWVRIKKQRADKKCTKYETSMASAFSRPSTPHAT